MFLQRMLRAITIFVIAISLLLGSITPPVLAEETVDCTVEGACLPFPPVPSASVAGPTLDESTMERREEPNRIPIEDSPNILIILLDDVGFGQADTFGGEIHTPTLSRLWDEGIAYNTFHTTSICSPTRAALLTGRNHHRVQSGTIAEYAVDWDGYLGVIPKTSATIAEVLSEYGYKTSAFGKWHNTPTNDTTAMGPFDRWPTGHGFDYFYGFIAGETSQYEPRLYENLNPIEPPHDECDNLIEQFQDECYHLSEDMADKAIAWMRHHRSYSPDKPFLMYWAPGAAHGPHHVFKKWADKYKGKFDDGWDEYQKRVFENQRDVLHWIPKDAELTPRPETIAAWDEIPESERDFQRRLMEVYAGFLEHVDTQAGKVISELDDLGIRDNTIVFYIVGDNGASAEGQEGTISEFLAQNLITKTVEEQLDALEELGGLDALGTKQTENMYHAGWAWAGDAPFRYTKLVASHFGGTRNPMVISWPKEFNKPDGITRNKTIRSQFHHVNDIAPTIYDILGITPPEEVYGFKQTPLDGISMKYTFDDANAPGQKKVQYFENFGSRGIYEDGWYACTFGPQEPWNTAESAAKLKEWDSTQDDWELYHITEDFTQMHDLAAQYPEKLKEMKKRFLEEAENNLAFPIGGSLWINIHTEDRIASPYTSWVFDEGTTRMPEFTAPGLGRQSNLVTIDVDLKKNTSGVLYALGGSGGGVSLFMDDGILKYEYNMLLLDRYKAASDAPLSDGHHTIEVETTIESLEEAGEVVTGEVVIRVDGDEVGRTTIEQVVIGAFSASETFDVGTDLGAPVSLDYAERAPFEFDGTINTVKVELGDSIEPYQASEDMSNEDFWDIIIQQLEKHYSTK
ncbi:MULTISPECIES: arylsulfatase [unclassified Okeania]|uniref:arylsulfatase n=1 Tax=unclassified Okeania TaxID=2634635 RepID=UPI00257E4AD4|nr:MULTISPECIES: arylsulfatase [unclassified Okeania]